MADTLEAALGTSTSEVLTIDNDLRTITIPNRFILGVYNDKDTHTVQFKGPKTYGNEDLSTYTARINYENAEGDGNTYTVVDLGSSGDNITFSWIVGEEAFKKAGDVKFIVCFIKTDSSGNITREFNTTIATVKVLEGFEAITTISSEDSTIIPGTTPTLFIYIDTELLSETSTVRIDIAQNDKTLMQVAGTIGESSVTYKFTQSETYKMKEGSIRIQAHGLMNDNDAWKTDIFNIKVGNTLTTTVLS